jgi:hypothetical protein
MSQTSSTTARGGIGVLGLLGVAFVILKLIGKIDWSWWLVTLPFWGGAALVIVFFIIAGLVMLIGSVLSGRRR